jgi:hypothetical protein
MGVFVRRETFDNEATLTLLARPQTRAAAG